MRRRVRVYPGERIQRLSSGARGDDRDYQTSAHPSGRPPVEARQGPARGGPHQPRAHRRPAPVPQGRPDTSDGSQRRVGTDLGRSPGRPEPRHAFRRSASGQRGAGCPCRRRGHLPMGLAPGRYRNGLDNRMDPGPQPVRPRPPGPPHEGTLRIRPRPVGSAHSPPHALPSRRRRVPLDDRLRQPEARHARLQARRAAHPIQPITPRPDGHLNPRPTSRCSMANTLQLPLPLRDDHGPGREHLGQYQAARWGWAW